MAPEDLLTRFTDKSVCDLLLALVESQLVTDTHRQTAIAQETSVIRLGHAINLGQDKALEGRCRNIGGERLKSGYPVSLEKDGVLVGSRLHGKLDTPLYF